MIGGLVIAILIAVIIYLVITIDRLKDYQASFNSLQDERPLVSRTIQMLSRDEGVDVATIEESFIPIVMNFPTKICIELRPRPGAIGASYIFCYRRESGQIIERHVVGE